MIEMVIALMFPGYQIALYSTCVAVDDLDHWECCQLACVLEYNVRVEGMS